MEKEEVKELFQKSNWDKKNILNRSNKKIQVQVLEKIEKEGVTLEDLRDLGLPVFKYMTQITLHGLFPTLSESKLQGYKYIFQNKNQSLGIKYNGVDTAKKYLIYKYLYHFGWIIQHNSTDWYAHQSTKYFTTKEEAEIELKALTLKVKHIDTSLFYGNIQIFSYKLLGAMRFVAILRINAVWEVNKVKLIENVLQNKIANLDKIIEETQKRREQERDEREKQQLLEKQRLANLRKPYLDNIGKYLTSLGFTLQEKTTLTEGMLRVHVIWNDETDFTYCVDFFHKTKNQKIFRKSSNYATNLHRLITDTIAKEYKNYDGHIFESKTISGWIMKSKDFRFMYVRTKK